MVRTSDLLARGVAALLCLLAVLGARPAAAQTVTLATDALSPYSRPDGTGYQDRIVTEAFGRIGVPVRIVSLPAERVLKNANEGLADGLYARIAKLEALYPDLVMVPEPISDFEFTAFTRDPSFKNATWENLRTKSVAIITGWKILENKFKGAPRLQKVRDEKALFALLEAGRAEVVVCGLHAGQELVQREKYADIRPVLPPLSVQSMFLYMNKKHAALVPKLAEALRDMRRDGTLQRLTRSGLEETRP